MPASYNKHYNRDDLKNYSLRFQNLLCKIVFIKYFTGSGFFIFESIFHISYSGKLQSVNNFIIQLENT